MASTRGCVEAAAPAPASNSEAAATPTAARRARTARPFTIVKIVASGIVRPCRRGLQLRPCGIARSTLKVVLAAFAATLAAPATALAVEPTLTVRTVPLHGARSLGAARPARFDLVAVHWRGPGSVRFRTRSAAGRWSGWQTADADVAPDAGTVESRPSGWHLGNPVWTGTA